MKLKLDKDLLNALPLDLTIEGAINKAMINITLMVQNSAKVNAPFKTWTLRKSIQSNLTKIKQGITIVWSPLIYARRREFENKKNPDRRFYLKRAYTENKNKIDKIIKEALKKELG